MKRIGFLPAFFTALAIVFAIAVYLRIRSYEDGDVRVRETAEAAPAVASQPQPPTSPAAPVETTMTMEPAPDPVPEPRQEEQKPGFLRSLIAPFLRPSATPSPRVSFSPPQRDPQPRAQQRPPAVTEKRERSAREEREEAREREKESASATSSQASSSSRGETGTGVTESDGTSDSSPPQLQAIEFSPPQIADGEETMLIVHAADDLSGVRSISGTILAPSGALQGFACQREGETNRFVARVTVPRDAADGMWVVNYINLLDNASNANPINAARTGGAGVASFRVTSSRSDTEGPILQAVWIDRRAMRGGDRNLVFVRATDDRAGLNLISGIFQSPTRVARVGFVCRGGDAAVWTCDLNAPSCADCGEWHLEQIQLQDKANNMTTVRAAQSEMLRAVRVDVSSDLCDSNPPSVESVVLDRHMVSNAEASAIVVTARLSDDACGVLSVSGQATGPTPMTGAAPRLYFSFSAAESDAGTWTGRLNVPRLAAKGTWRVSFLQVLDRGQNLRVYGANDPLLGNAAFEVR